MGFLILCTPEIINRNPYFYCFNFKSNYNVWFPNSKSIEQNNIFCIKYRFQGCKVFDDFFINRWLNLKIYSSIGFSKKNNTFHQSLRCNSFYVCLFLFKKTQKFQLFFAAPCSNFEEVVHAELPSLKVS